MSLPPTHDVFWERLAGMEPADVEKRSGASYDAKRNGYVVSFCNEQYLLVPKTKQILRISGGKEEEANFDLSLTLLVYLLESKSMPFSGEWITEQGFSTGPLFFKGGHSLSTQTLADAFGKDLTAFIEAGRRLGASAIAEGDAGIEVPTLPKVPLRFILWKADDEFPAQVTTLFDKTAEFQLPFDALGTLVKCVVKQLVRLKDQG